MIAFIINNPYTIRFLHLLKILLLAGVVFAAAAGAAVGGFFIYFSFTLPDPAQAIEKYSPETTKIYSKDGALLYEIHGDEKRTKTTLDTIPPHVRDAVIAVEDKNFYKHFGIDLEGVARAFFSNLEHGEIREGGSTLTQQLVRNAVLTREKTYIRKFKEMVLAINMELEYGKNEILEMYFNEIPYGSYLYGIQSASQNYFDKKPGELTIAEAAYLAALPKAPTYYSPYGENRKELDRRAAKILQLMQEQGFITEEEKEKALAEEVEFKQLSSPVMAPHFVFYVSDLLTEKYGEEAVKNGGLEVITSLDMNLQTLAEDIVKKQLPAAERRYVATNASLVAVDPKSGEVLAMVGSRDFFDKPSDGEVNVALQPRQPGSSFKPYVYAAAFKEGMSPATLLMDLPTNFGLYGSGPYIPRNYNGRNYGPVSVRKALQGSLNVPAVKTLMLVGIDDAVDTAESMGITTLGNRERFGPALVLGGAEVTLLEHTRAYGAFAAGGTLYEPAPILRINDKTGKTIYNANAKKGRRILDEKIAYQINHVLSDNQSRLYIYRNPNNKLSLPGRRVAAKTGTTQDFRDAWTLGYTPSLAAGVWVGNNNNRAMRYGASGTAVAAPIWNEFMSRALEGAPPEEFPRPPGIVEIAVDSLSGKLPTKYTPSVKTEIFAEGINVPAEKDDMHQPITFGGEVLGIATVFRAEKPGDPGWEIPVRRWTLARGYSYRSAPNIAVKETEIIDAGGAAEGQLASAVSASQIDITAVHQIISLPWQVNIQVPQSAEVFHITLKIDGALELRQPGNSVFYQSSRPLSDGPHTITAEVATPSGVYTKNLTVNFALGDLAAAKN